MSGSENHQEVGLRPLPLASLSLRYNNASHSRIARGRGTAPHHAPSHPIQPSNGRNLTHSLPHEVESSSVPSRQGHGPISHVCNLLKSVPHILSRPLSWLHRTQGAASSTTPAFPRVFPSLLHPPALSLPPPPPKSVADPSIAIVWFRNDLRLHDHEALAMTNHHARAVLPVYIFDPREYGKGPSGFDKTGPGRAQFILESVADLRQRLQARGSDLIVRIGRPELVLPALAQQVGAGRVACHGEVSEQDCQVESAVQNALARQGASLEVVWGGTLLHPEDLPFQVDSMPCDYRQFRARVEGLSVRVTAEVPGEIKGMPETWVDSGTIPTMKQLGFTSKSSTLPTTSMGDNTLKGGETEALNHLDAFLSHMRDHLQRAVQDACGGAKHKEQPGSRFSAKISPWLAMGCISPRHLYHAIRNQISTTPAIPNQPGSHTPTTSSQQLTPKSSAQASVSLDMFDHWLVFELMWRDFFRFVTKKYADTAGETGKNGAAPVRLVHA